MRVIGICPPASVAGFLIRFEVELPGRQDFIGASLRLGPGLQESHDLRILGETVSLSDRAGCGAPAWLVPQPADFGIRVIAPNLMEVT